VRTTIESYCHGQTDDPITIEQIRELARQLSPPERQALLDSLLAERFNAVMAESDRRRPREPTVADEQIQTEVDVVRRQRRQDRQRGGSWLT